MTSDASDSRQIEEEDENDFDIIIVGAGLSGLAAANKLISAGLNILMLEQGDSTGGRLLTPEISKAFYGHELQKKLNEMSLLFRLAREKEKFPYTRNILYLNNNEIVNTDLPFYISGEIYFFLKTVDNVSKGEYFKSYKKDKFTEQLAEISLEDLLCRLVFFNESRSFCRSLIYATCGMTQLHEVSALWYLVMLNGAGGLMQRLRINLGDSKRYFIKGGAANLAQWLTRSVSEKNEIHNNELVLKIQFNDDRAHVSSNKGHYKCEYVILAVSPIESVEIDVEPELPLGIKKALSSYTTEENIFFVGKGPHLIKPHSLTKNIIKISPDSTNLLLAYDATVSYDNQFRIAGFLSSANTDSQMKDNLLATLNKCFQSNVTQFKEYKEIDWDLLSGGSPMCVPRPGSLSQHLSLLAESHGRVFFAASEYAKCFPGTIDGAIEAGESVAYTILERIRPQSISLLEWKLKKTLRVTRPTKEFNTGISIIHKICFCLNLFAFLSFLRIQYLSQKFT